MDHLTANDLPSAPPEGFMDWVSNKLLGGVHALLYRAGTYRDPLTGLSEKVVNATCSACGRSFQFDRIEAPRCPNAGATAPFGFMNGLSEAMIHGSHMLCPHCQAQVSVIHIGSFRGTMQISERFPLTVQAVQGRLVLFCWRIRRDINKAGAETTRIDPWLAYVVEAKKINCFQGYYQFFYSTSQLDHWESRSRFEDKIGCNCPVFPWDKKILNGTTAENCKLNLYLRCSGDIYPASYLKLWCRRPSVENLLMSGAGNLLARMIADDVKGRSYYSLAIPKLDFINWREKRPSKMLGLTKEEFRAAVTNKWSVELLKIFVDMKNRNQTPNLSTDIALIKALGPYEAAVLLGKEIPEINYMQAFRYLQKQKSRTPSLIGASFLSDYWRMAQDNGADLSDPQIRYPQNLRRAHDQQAERQRFKKQEALLQKFADRAEALAIYTFEADGLLIRPVATQEELYQEGKILNHCVYSYANRHVSGHTAILLIRKTADPGTPFYTLELNEKNMTVVQDRGLRNCGKTKEVQAFEEKWLTWAKQQNEKRRKAS